MASTLTATIEECTACGRLVDIKQLIETPLGYYICDDFQECIADYSGWGQDLYLDLSKEEPIN